MQTTYSIHEIENAINQWRNLERSGTVILGSNTRQLADIYGAMIYAKSVVVNAVDLSAAQINALAVLK